jgi:hypothetical protein
MFGAMDKMRGLYRYETAPDRWWACADDFLHGVRVHIERIRYERMGIKPPFLELPVQSTNGDRQEKAA